MTKQCTRFTLNETFHTFGVPPTAQFVDTFIIGTNADEKYGLAVNGWIDNNGPNGTIVIAALK